MGTGSSKERFYPPIKLHEITNRRNLRFIFTAVRIQNFKKTRLSTMQRPVFVGSQNTS